MTKLGVNRDIKSPENAGGYRSWRGNGNAGRKFCTVYGGGLFVTRGPVCLNEGAFENGWENLLVVVDIFENWCNKFCVTIFFEKWTWGMLKSSTVRGPDLVRALTSLSKEAELWRSFWSGLGKISCNVSMEYISSLTAELENHKQNPDTIASYISENKLKQEKV